MFKLDGWNLKLEIVKVLYIDLIVDVKSTLFFSLLIYIILRVAAKCYKNCIYASKFQTNAQSA